MAGRVVRLLLIPVLAGLVASIIAYAALGRRDAHEAQVETVKVLVARDKVPARTPLTAAMFTTAHVPKQLAAGAVTDPAAVEGRLLDAPLVPGEVLLAAKLVDPNTAALPYRIPAGMRAVTIRVDEFSGVAGYPQPGDRVDVILVLPGLEGRAGGGAAAGPRAAHSRLLFERVEVLARGPALPDAGGQVPGPGPGQLSSYTLALTPEQAVELALAEELGHFKLALRPADETREDRKGQIIVDETRYAWPR